MEDEDGGDGAGQEQPAQGGDAVNERSGSDAARRRANARPTSCSSGWNSPGPTTIMTAHNTAMASKPASSRERRATARNA